MKYLLITVIAIFASGCAKDVKSWEKSILAKETMKDDGVNTLVKKYEDHIYYSKEASKGGASIGSGGCGCN